MPKHHCSRIPETFLPGRGFTRDLTPLEFLQHYHDLCHVINVAQSDLHTIMHFRGWRAYGASSGPKCVMRKTFPTGRTVETSEKLAPEIEALACHTLIAQPAPPPAKPQPSPRRRKS